MTLGIIIGRLRMSMCFMKKSRRNVNAAKTDRCYKNVEKGDGNLF
jgi:hypothetical protein